MSGCQLPDKQGIAVLFSEDLYLYDLNQLQSAPLAHRSATGGGEQPLLLDLLGITAREWLQHEDRLYSTPICLAGMGGTLVLPLFGSIGRLGIVIKPHVSLPALAYILATQALGTVYTDTHMAEITPAMSAQDREMAERVIQTVAMLRLLIDTCHATEHAYAASECISLAAQLWGVELMPQETVEFPPMQGKWELPEMQISGQTLAVVLMTLLSFMRNHARARSGWLYAAQDEECVALHAAVRMSPDTSTEALVHLRKLLEDAGVVIGTHSFAAPVKPPRQYAYMNRKITDPRHPFCAHCGCLDKRCNECTALQWAVLPYVYDAALLGIKDLPVFVPLDEHPNDFCV